jgi:hypothetical protein
LLITLWYCRQPTAAFAITPSTLAFITPDYFIDYRYMMLFMPLILIIIDYIFRYFFCHAFHTHCIFFFRWLSFSILLI